MRRAFVAAFVSVLLAPALAPGGASAQDAGGLPEKLAAAKQAAARNQQALRSYAWRADTQLSFKGEVKNTKVESCQYGPDGKVQKTNLSEPPAPQQKRGLRGRVVAKKTGEMKEELESATALVHRYVPPSPEKMQAVIAAGKASLAQAGPGALALRFPDYEKAGDALTLTFDAGVKALRRVAVSTYMDDPSQPVTLEVDLQSLPDGTNYPGSVALKIPASQVEVRIQNSNYQKVAP